MKSPGFFNIQHIGNIASILQYGLCCHKVASSFFHESIANPDVQDRRERLSIPGKNLNLHDYVPLFFNPRGPMMYKLKVEGLVDNLCILIFDFDVIEQENVIVADGNAAADFTRFFTPEEGLDNLQAELIMAMSWDDPDEQMKKWRKRMIAAEILVKGIINPDKICGAYVSNKKNKEKLLQCGFSKPVFVNSKLFFSKEDQQ